MSYCADWDGSLLRVVGVWSRREACAISVVAATAIIIRTIPEFLSFPYLIGYDTIYYAGEIQRAQSCLDLISTLPSPFLPLALCPFGKMVGVLTLFKIYPPLAYGASAGTLFLFARKSLGLDRFQSILSSLFVVLQFGMLRVSWDLHSNLLGMAFLLLLLVALSGPTTSRRLLAIASLTLLVVLAHALTALLMVGIFLIMGAASYLRRDFARLWNVLVGILVSVPMLCWMAFINPALVSQLFTKYTWPDTMQTVPLFFVLLCLPMLPLIFLGRRPSRFEAAWMAFAGTLAFSSILLPVVFSFWDRWMFMMLPVLGLLAASGMLRVADVGTRFIHGLGRARRRSYVWDKTIRAALIVLIFAPSVYIALGFMTYPSNHPFWYLDNSLLWKGSGSGVPASMLENTIALQDIPDLMRVISQLNQIVEGKDVVLAADAFYGWLRLYLNEGKSMIWFRNYDPVQSVIALAKQRGFRTIYMVWFVPGASWHLLGPDLSSFRVVVQSGIIAAYQYS